MPSVYLSPSTQESNLFVIGGSEEQYMNMIADAMIPHLQRYGISYDRNTPGMTARSSIAQSNAGNYDLHVAIHSNASAPSQAGQNRGTIIFYYPTSQNGLRLANIIRNNFTGIYPLPNLVRTSPTTSLGEVTQTRAPSVLIEVAFHDNYADANWIANNINLIALAIANSIAQYFGIPVSGGGGTTQPSTRQRGRVTLTSGYLNIRNGPSTASQIIGTAPNRATVEIIRRVGDWYQILYNGINGYVFGRYITLL